MINFFLSLNYKLLFDVDVELGLKKADRLIFGGTFTTHSMVFSGVSLDKEEIPTKFRVENSLSEKFKDETDKFLVMTRQWFNEFVSAVVIDKKYLSESVLKVHSTQPVLLPAWDPLGNLCI